MTRIWLRVGAGLILVCCGLLVISMVMGTARQRYGSEITFVVFVPEARVFELRRYDWLTGVEAPLTALDFQPNGLSWSPDGERLAISESSDATLHILEPDGTLTTPALPGVDGAQTPSWSSDGEHIAFSTIPLSATIVRPAIHVLNVADYSVEPVTRGDSNDFFPVYSPDGERIAFVSDRSQTFGIFVMDESGRDIRELARPQRGLASRVSWSPDGEYMAYTGRFGAAQLNLFRLNVDTRQTERLTRGGYGDGATGAPIWSPDGKHILFTSNRNKADEIQLYQMDSDGTGIRQLTRSYVYLAWPVWRP